MSSSRKSRPNLNISGFSPIQRKLKRNSSFLISQVISLKLVNISSPTTYKSPGKDYGINERIELGKEKIISGYDRWKLAETNGAQYVNLIHNSKEKSRRAGETPYPSELETYCKKLAAVKTVFEDVIKSAEEFRKEIFGSINILESMKDNEELKYRLLMVEQFLDSLIQLYNSSLNLKLFIIGE